jgi:hypothetical protein
MNVSVRVTQRARARSLCFSLRGGRSFAAVDLNTTPDFRGTAVFDDADVERLPVAEETTDFSDTRTAFSGILGRRKDSALSWYLIDGMGGMSFRVVVVVDSR